MTPEVFFTSHEKTDVGHVLLLFAMAEFASNECTPYCIDDEMLRALMNADGNPLPEITPELLLQGERLTSLALYVQGMQKAEKDPGNNTPPEQIWIFLESVFLPIFENKR